VYHSKSLVLLGSTAASILTSQEAQRKAFQTRQTSKTQEDLKRGFLKLSDQDKLYQKKILMMHEKDCANTHWFEPTNPVSEKQ